MNNNQKLTQRFAESTVLHKLRTFDNLATEYMEMYSKINKRSKSHQEAQRMLDNIILKRLGFKKLNEITAHDIQQILHELRETPYMANRVCALLRQMFSLAIRWKWGTTNPVEGVNKHEEQKRDRGLNNEEAQQLFSVLETYPNQNVSNAMRFLFLTGSRLSDVLGATWSQFDLENKVWIKPSHSAKQNRMEYFSLSQQAIELLEHMKVHATSSYLFSGEPRQDIKKALETISAEAGISKLLLRDLRYSYASQLFSQAA